LNHSKRFTDLRIPVWYTISIWWIWLTELQVMQSDS